MYVVLDTSAIIDDYHLNSQKFKTLFEYIKKTPHKIIIPQIVLDELVSKYERELSKQKINLEKNNYAIKKLISGWEMKDLNKEALLLDYKNFINSLSINKKVLVVEYDKEDYLEIVAKAINKKPPFVPHDGNDSGFKDSIVWQSVKKITTEVKPEHVAFISANTSQFFNKEQNFLNEDLLKELMISTSGNQDRLHTFNSVGSFLQKYDILITDLSEDTIYSTINFAFEEKKGELDIKELYSLFKNAIYMPWVNISMSSYSVEDYFAISKIENVYKVVVSGEIIADITMKDPIDEYLITEQARTQYETIMEINKKDNFVNVKSFTINSVPEREF